jgi:hypothetical protein
MKSAPSQTIVSGLLRKCEPAPDGFGGDVEIQVELNESPDPAADFIRPAPGTVLRAFFGELGPPQQRWTGLQVRATLTFLGGPGGGRAVVQRLVKR